MAEEFSPTVKGAGLYVGAGIAPPTLPAIGGKALPGVGAGRQCPPIAGRAGLVDALLGGANRDCPTTPNLGDDEPGEGVGNDACVVKARVAGAALMAGDGMLGAARSGSGIWRGDGVLERAGRAMSGGQLDPAGGVYVVVVAVDAAYVGLAAAAPSGAVGTVGAGIVEAEMDVDGSHVGTGGAE